MKRIRMEHVQEALITASLEGREVYQYRWLGTKYYGYLKDDADIATLVNHEDVFGKMHIIFRWTTRRAILVNPVPLSESLETVKISWKSRYKPESWDVLWRTNGKPAVRRSKRRADQENASEDPSSTV